MQKKVVARAIGLVLSGVLVAGAANAAEQKVAQPEVTSVNVQGVQVAIDPATGRMVAPSAAQRAALSAAMLKQANAAPLKTANALSQRPRNELEAVKTLKRTKTGKYAAVMQVPETLVSSLVAQTRADGSVAIHHQDEAATSSQPVQEVLQ
ncbi:MULTISPECIES: post-PEP-CTERM-1 domain-containing protein [Rhodanobacter]|uniref:Uncharacterized protein n=2 Tax=Rhodanobacter TaxID=75309 RepID=I4W2Q6_9GAMM|nr:hypothetical protein [Rhodanobacter spathiphylli]EIL93747.1 hypothetical protein UU7_07886 [Rhodanobacter spathiphylli B39]